MRSISSADPAELVIQHDEGAALLRQHLTDRSVTDVDLGVGSFLTFSFTETTVRLWIYLAAWNVSESAVMMAACEDEREFIRERVQRLAGREVTEVHLDASNNLFIELSGEVRLNVLATNIDESPWLLFDTGAWFLGANTDGTFSLEQE